MEQDGSYNEAEILQRAGFGNAAGVFQLGTGTSFLERNLASISQTGGSINSAGISQSGMSNNARITQQ